VYDPSGSVRRPVLSVSHDDCPMTTVCPQPNVFQYVPDIQHNSFVSMFLLLLILCLNPYIVDFLLVFRVLDSRC